MPLVPANTLYVEIAPSRILGASLTYFALVFATGFVLGAVRVPFIEPRFGKFLATLIEAPIMIVAITIAARYVTVWFAFSGRRFALSLVGGLAIAFMVVADLGVGLFLRQMSFDEQLFNLMTPGGLTYLLLLAIFAAMPLIRDLWRQRERRANRVCFGAVVCSDQDTTTPAVGKCSPDCGQRGAVRSPPLIEG